MATKYAIIVNDARKEYEKGKLILDALNMAVPKGCIYGLLGPSGCGKTTLLSSMAGVTKLDSGDIWILGGKPKSKESGIPGPRVGYMPQDVSLVDEFSVINACYYFGRINGLDNHIIEERYLFLKDLLQLQPRDHLVRNMSGGQQRRLSFAVALLHKPELLILDEPTVGLDPVLRDNIWNHLDKITREDGITVIITTHYIEEARQSDTIGLLRKGKLLAETSPNELLDMFQTDSLEEAFLNLSARTQTNFQDRPPVSIAEMNKMLTVESIYNSGSRNHALQWRSSAWKRCHSLFMKNYVQFLRHPGGIMFSLVLPLMQLALLFFAVGKDPTGISISIVNDEAGDCNNGRNWGNVTYDERDDTCKFVDLSCRMIHGINDSVVKKVYYDDYEGAVRDISRQKSVGVMYFSKNFSSAMAAKIEEYYAVTEEDLVASQIDVMMYTPDRQISLFVQRKLLKSFFEEFREIVRACRISPKYANFPIRFEEPIFGELDQNYITMIFPPYILMLTFITTTSMCSSIIITDRHSGMWDRNLVQGVKTWEILITHIVSQTSLIVVQTIVLICICFSQFDVHCKGSMIIVCCMPLLSGICGMSYGFLISVLCTSHTLVNYASVGSFYPLFLLSGLIWPIEGMPEALKWISLTLPTTLPGISLRGVLEKGTPFEDPEVYSGFLILIGWILGLVMICVVHLRMKTT
ncbi:ABC transporter G family member 23-like isoform X1 [Hylaeus anthracinus]|uniref:ABC transporter G family member 23-like isoform X1 n=2 Tax=Hylaeus anthracinus TaxID=313031 RepID=UPI0023B99C7F|nr:ABC transporter G family member 23-like isoform X1 [Hylaeus anthracinus]